MPDGGTLLGAPERKESSRLVLLLSASGSPTDHRSGLGTRVSNICQGMRLGSSAKLAFHSNDGGWCAVELIAPVLFKWQMPRDLLTIIAGRSIWARILSAALVLGALILESAAAQFTLERVVLVSRHGVRAPTDSRELN